MRVVFMLFAAALVAASCSGGGSDDRSAGPPSGDGGLSDVASAGSFGETFDRDAGSPRLVLLLSPT
jgi:hypothetical protein